MQAVRLKYLKALLKFDSNDVTARKPQRSEDTVHREALRLLALPPRPFPGAEELGCDNHELGVVFTASAGWPFRCKIRSLAALLR